MADLAEQAARLCKADLVTEMVGEFPELQGLMGGYYAAKEGLPQEVAEAIRDHYKPVGQGDDVPTAPVTVAVSLADKLDTLVGFFAIDEKPTGSKDPFALRRAANAVLRLVIQNNLRLSLAGELERYCNFTAVQLEDAVWLVLGAMRNTGEQKFQNVSDLNNKTYQILRDGEQIASGSLEGETLRAATLAYTYRMDREKIVDEVLDFFADRLKVQQREAGVRHDLIDAVFALGGEDDLVRLLARVHALQAFVTTEDGTNLLAGYKRAANILKKTPIAQGEGASDGIEHTGEEDPLSMIDDPDLADLYAPHAAPALSYTPEPAEKALIDALAAAAPLAAQAVEAERFADAMAALATLRAPIDRFFEEVTVNAEEADKRQARLALLARFRDAVHRVADFSRIEG